MFLNYLSIRIFRNKQIFSFYIHLKQLISKLIRNLYLLNFNSIQIGEFRAYN